MEIITLIILLFPKNIIGEFYKSHIDIALFDNEYFPILLASLRLYKW